MKNIAANVKILTNGKEISHLENFEVLTNKIKEIKGDDKIRTIEFEDGTTLDIDGIFISSLQSSI